MLNSPYSSWIYYQYVSCYILNDNPAHIKKERKEGRGGWVDYNAGIFILTAESTDISTNQRKSTGFLHTLHFFFFSIGRIGFPLISLILLIIR